MSSGSRLIATIGVLAGMLLLAGAAAGAAEVRVALGDTITLSGYSSGSSDVYLFLTGPNLPVNGVALNDISRRADKGGFTRVSVNGDGRWTYAWHTGSLNGRLDEGTYTVWVVDTPSDRSQLAYADYQTLSVTLTRPFVMVNTPVPPGGMELHSVPEGASLTVNGQYRGRTPLTIGDLPSGRYQVTFSRLGFLEVSTQVAVEAGRTSEVTATLEPSAGSLAINSTPAGARVQLDGTDAGVTPVVTGNVSTGNHTLTLRFPGYRDAILDVAVAAGRTTPVEITLEPAVTAPPPVTRAAAGILMPAGAILFLIRIRAGRTRRATD